MYYDWAKYAKVGFSGRFSRLDFLCPGCVLRVPKKKHLKDSMVKLLDLGSFPFRQRYSVGSQKGL